MQADRDAPLWFLRTAFLPDDWIAVLLKCYDNGEAVQRVGSVGMVLDERFQGWLRFKNAQHFNVFVSANALTPGRRSRTRESIGAVRHLFLDADQDADRVMSAIADRRDLPTPSCVLRSSKDRAHVLWRVEGLSVERAEALQKHLARELGTDVAATSAAQMTRLPGFFNHKYTPSQLVEVNYSSERGTYGSDNFPDAPAVVAAPQRIAHEGLRPGRLPVTERARRYLAATPPAIQGQLGDSLTFRVCCRLIDRFGLTNQETLIVLTDWNARCRPPWPESALTAKIRTARRRVESSR